jgi:hypothetical protein
MRIPVIVTVLCFMTRAIAEEHVPEVEFKVMLVIKQQSDTWHPLFLPIRSRMTDTEVSNARRCFGVETADMVKEITGGKVRFTPVVHVSDQPLKVFEAARRDSAEYFAPELLNEFRTIAKPGEYDSVGYYFLHYDTKSGYSIPRAGYGVGGFNSQHGMGLFAINCVPRIDPRDEIFLHEWMHGLDGFYGGKAGVRLPNGTLHGGQDHGYSEKPWRAGDTFRGWMEWYRDYMCGTVREGSDLVGLGSAAWKHGPMRSRAAILQRNYTPSVLPTGKYPDWIHEMMAGNLYRAVLGAPLFEDALEPGPLVGTSWNLSVWDKNAGTTVEVILESGGSAIVIDNPKANSTSLNRTVEVEPSTNYLFSADIRTENVQIRERGGRFAVHLHMGDSVSTRDMSGTVPWTSVSIPVTTGPRTKSQKVKLAVGGGGSITEGRAFFRNIRLRKIDWPEGAAGPVSVPGLSWASSDGRVITATFIKLVGDAVILEKEGGRQYSVPLSTLAPASVEQAKRFGSRQAGARR